MASSVRASRPGGGVDGGGLPGVVALIILSSFVIKLGWDILRFFEFFVFIENYTL
jgi:hypothetical protein